MKSFLYLELAKPVPKAPPDMEPTGCASAFRVILSAGGTVRRLSPLDEWRAGNAIHGHRIAERYVEALADAGYLVAYFEKEAA
jgi:hypothetical protein